MSCSFCSYMSHSAQTAPWRRAWLLIRAVNHIETMLFYCPVERDVLGSLPGPRNHEFLCELILVQLLFAFCGQNAVNECEGVTVAVVAVFFIPYKTRKWRREAFALKAAQNRPKKLLKAFYN